MYKGKTIAVVIPAYNDEKLVTETLMGIPDYVDQIYVVDDGSTDNTLQAVKAQRDQRIVTLGDGINRGPGAALITGYKQALKNRIDIIVKMDSDHQMDPNHIPVLLEPIIEGKSEYSKGDRLSKDKHKNGMSRWRRFGNLLLTWLTRIASGNYKLSDPQNGYTAITNNAVANILNNNIYPRYGYLNDIIVKLSAFDMPITDVPMPSRYGNEKSKIQYHTYIPKVSWLLLKLFVWRLSRKIAR